MAARQVVTKIKPLASASLANSASGASGGGKQSLLPQTNHPFLIFKSGEMTQATQLTPDCVVARVAGPCRPSPPVCPPPPCACPLPPERLTLARRLLRLLWLLTRLALFASAVQFTIDEGVWGDAEQSEDIAKRLGLMPESEADAEAKSKEESKVSLAAVVKMWDDLVMKVGELVGLSP